MNKGFKYYANLPYSIEVHPSPEGGYSVRIPELQGCISQGDTIAEAIEMIEDAKRCWIDIALEDGVAIPEPKKLTIIVASLLCACRRLCTKKYRFKQIKMV